MKKITTTFSILFIATICLTSCKKDAIDTDEISQEVKDKIYAAGFGTSNIQKIEEGHLVEGDIILTKDWLDNNPARQILRMPNGEQYHTTNLVTGLPRVITVSLNNKLAARPGFPQALQQMVDNYNAIPGFDGITFQVAANGRGKINFVNASLSLGIAAMAGFPTSRGEPYPTVKINETPGSSYEGWIAWMAYLMEHEVGHCIGLRHTNWFDRSIICGGTPSNEGAGGAGAIWIPGTPLMPAVDSSSVMLSCINFTWPGTPPFSYYDQIALDYLY